MTGRQDNSRFNTMADTTLPPISQNPNITSQDTSQLHSSSNSAPTTTNQLSGTSAANPNSNAANNATSAPLTGVVINGDVPKDIRIAQRRARIEARRNERLANGQQQNLGKR